MERISDEKITDTIFLLARQRYDEDRTLSDKEKYIATADAQLAADRKELEDVKAEYEERIAKIKADEMTYCAYCGEEFTIDAEGTPQAVSEHIANCPKHPIQDYKTLIKGLENVVQDFMNAIRRLSPVCAINYEGTAMIVPLTKTTTWKHWEKASGIEAKYIKEVQG